jgi:uncharacterized membrane protein YoaK (UPF0700 family)
MKRQTGTALTLNWIAGYVDAVGFIAFFQIYLGNMLPAMSVHSSNRFSGNYASGRSQAMRISCRGGL